MTIAILGWGSLIWDPRNLKIDTAYGKEGWSEIGPLLPIEFGRVSNDGRLTLVIIPNKADEIQTLYAFSKFEILDEAILDLAVREGCGKNKIGFCKKDEPQFSDNFTSNKFQKQRQTISEWLIDKHIDAVIWTNLSPNHKDKFNLDEFTPLDAVKT